VRSKLKNKKKLIILKLIKTKPLT